MKILTLKHLLAVIILNKSAGFWAIWRRCRPFVYANLKGLGSRNTATTKMKLFDQITLSLDILKRKTIVLAAKVIALYGVKPFWKIGLLHR